MKKNKKSSKHLNPFFNPRIYEINKKKMEYESQAVRNSNQNSYKRLKEIIPIRNPSNDYNDYPNIKKQQNNEAINLNESFFDTKELLPLNSFFSIKENPNKIESTSSESELIRNKFIPKCSSTPFHFVSQKKLKNSENKTNIGDDFLNADNNSLLKTNFGEAFQELIEENQNFFTSNTNIFDINDRSNQRSNISFNLEKSLNGCKNYSNSLLLGRNELLSSYNSHDFQTISKKNLLPSENSKNVDVHFDFNEKSESNLNISKARHIFENNSISSNTFKNIEKEITKEFFATKNLRKFQDEFKFPDFSFVKRKSSSNDYKTLNNLEFRENSNTWNQKQFFEITEPNDIFEKPFKAKLVKAFENKIDGFENFFIKDNLKKIESDFKIPTFSVEDFFSFKSYNYKNTERSENFSFKNCSSKPNISFPISEPNDIIKKNTDKPCSNSYVENKVDSDFRFPNIEKFHHFHEFTNKKERYNRRKEMVNSEENSLFSDDMKRILRNGEQAKNNISFFNTENTERNNSFPNLSNNLEVCASSCINPKTYETIPDIEFKENQKFLKENKGTNNELMQISSTRSCYCKTCQKQQQSKRKISDWFKRNRKNNNNNELFEENSEFQNKVDKSNEISQQLTISDNKFPQIKEHDKNLIKSLMKPNTSKQYFIFYN